MSKDPFVILGLSESATKDEAYYAYRDLRMKYEGLRFEPGEVGEDACAKLEELETAYNDVIAKIDERDAGWNREDTRSRFINEKLDRAEENIKANHIDEAQSYLDECTTRTAKWHYLQSAVFYKKGWTQDALKQLELASDMEPTNKKYTDARDSLRKHIKANTTEQSNSFYENGTRNERTYADNRSGYMGAQRRGCTVCDMCSGLLCADCCCECFGGDLISCC